MYLHATGHAKARQAIEAQIVKKVVTDALAQGYTLSVHDGEEQHAPTIDTQLLYSQLIETDEDFLYFLKDGERIGWVRFVYGNDGWDVISDYTTNLENALIGALQLAEKLEG